MFIKLYISFIRLYHKNANNSIGYRIYSDLQLLIDDDGIHETKFSLEDCALYEVTTNKKFIYVPTYNDVLCWILQQDENWVLCVRWNNKLRGFYFSVQNRETGYEYDQPTAPGETNLFKLYEWGLEHIVNRLNIIEDKE